jgi:hypothetical protein
MLTSTEEQLIEEGKMILDPAEELEAINREISDFDHFVQYYSQRSLNDAATLLLAHEQAFMVVQKPLGLVIGPKAKSVLNKNGMPTDDLGIYGLSLGPL